MKRTKIKPQTSEPCRTAHETRATTVEGPKPTRAGKALATTSNGGGASGNSLSVALNSDRLPRRTAKEKRAQQDPSRTASGTISSPTNPDESTNRECASDGVSYSPHPAPAAGTDHKNLGSGSLSESLIRFRPYQHPVFLDRQSGILILHWSRQIGKSFTLATWGVDRLLTQLQRYDTWLITVLSNSRDNGAEFVLKCADVCNKLGIAMEKQAKEIGDAAVYVAEDHSPDIKYDNMRMEVRITVGNRVGRIKVLAANPRTARGFSGDLILDEFAFHEDSNAIWEAAEPILSSNPEFLCRISSTGNGKYNMFYRMASGPGLNDGTPFISSAGFKVCRVTRTEAWKQGVKVYDPNTRQPITPDQARAKALDKRAYDQNYECLFNDENMALLTQELISAAERDGIPIDEQSWTPASVARMYRATGDLHAGQDVGRNRDLSVCCVIEKDGQKRRVIAMLRMSGMRLPDQQRQLDVLCAMPKFRALEIDMTGIGLGLFEYAQDKWGSSKIRGVNFATTEPITSRIRAEGRKTETARVTEIMATEMLAVFEDRAIEIPADTELRDDLRKPEKITSPGGRVSIAAIRDDAGHADHFWSVALAIRAGDRSGGPFAYQAAKRPAHTHGKRRKGVMV